MNQPKPNAVYHRWTDAEIAILESEYGRHNTDDLARKIGVDADCLRRKAKALRLGYQREADEYISMRQLRGILHLEGYSILRLMLDGMPYTRRTFGKKTQNYLFRIDSVLKWLRAHPDAWSAEKVEQYAFGKEPEWLKEKRRKDRATGKDTHHAKSDISI